ncbi:FtsX-like permease family protein [Ichthyenterobacterium sp. W332]|uniref:FtsX-like permease family protein n=1 Tax=Microcosmobacter mediterraneus TaxID=3075607 RepID=A0ABU2YLR1_9FLAO|nr:FtsX-like permease family protein [Ichthyenterobacterium sp. W332]MDT0557998.1 FtsX-like permease family protein [Ichthyenterobacterium sp. W332]
MSIIASSGVVIASAALLIVLSGFAGLKDYSLEFSSLIDPDLKVFPKDGKTIELSNNALNKILIIEGVSKVSKTLEERAMLKFNDKPLVAFIKGVDDQFNAVTSIDSLIPQGNWLTNNSNEVVAGWGISNSLSFGVLDYARVLEVSVPKPGKGQFSSASSLFNSVNTINVGLFDINEDLNNTYVFASLDLVQALLNYNNNQISNLEVKLTEDADVDFVSSKIASILNNNVEVKNRAQLNDALYKMLNTENLIVYLIFTLVIIIALFNVIGAIIMMILDRKRSLQTLFNLGAEPLDIRRIFFLQGSLMTLLSGIIGIVLAILLIGLQKLTGFIMLTASLPYPVHLKPLNIVLVFITFSTLGILASKIASNRITKSLIKLR